jgi:hypothetical protein
MQIIQRDPTCCSSRTERRPLGCPELCGVYRLLAFCLWFAAMVARAGEGVEPPISPTERVRLFNGNDLGGFYTWLVDTKSEDPRHVFAVTNGMIRISGEGLGYLATEKGYRNYHLVAEFKWGKTNWHWGDRIGRARDSGIFLHAIGPDGNSHDGQGAFMAAINLPTRGRA